MSAPTQRFSTLLEEYGHVVRRAIRHVAPRELGSDIDDLEQEARLRIWRAVERDTSIEKPSSYFYRLAVRVTLDAVQRRGARREEPLETEGPERVDHRPTPERSAQRSQQLESVRRTMALLPANRRRAVGLHLQGFTTTEIAALCGWTEPKARNLAYRGLDDLRRRLASSNDDEPETLREAV